MAASMSVASAVGSGDITRNTYMGSDELGANLIPSSSVHGQRGGGGTVQRLLQSGADPNKKSSDGMTPLAVAAFWGYDDIMQLLIRSGADINSTNNGTLWTPLHCASFQGHGKVIMKLMEHQPDLYKVDSEGRSAIDFASALDSIWAFFAALGCKRTPRADLARMGIIRKVSPDDPSVQKEDILEFSRPGSAYIFNDRLDERKQNNLASASMMGDVLAGVDDERDESYWNKKMNNPSLAIWNS